VRDAGVEKNPLTRALADFDRAIQEKIHDICRDAGRGAVPGQTAWLPGYGDAPRGKGSIRLHCGSCFDILPTLEEETCTAIITSPPYCNRYDYTRGSMRLLCWEPMNHNSKPCGRIC
jgi:hypothetical protein